MQAHEMHSRAQNYSDDHQIIDSQPEYYFWLALVNQLHRNILALHVALEGR